MVIGSVLKIGNVIYKLARGAGRFTSGETSILTRFPPNYRPYIKEIIKGANIVTAGGIISDVLQQEWNELQTPKRPKFTPGKFTQKRSQYSEYNRSKRYSSNNYRRHKRQSCSCEHCRRTNFM